MPGRPCKIDVVLDFISEPWTLAVIHQLSVGPRRTVELFSSFDGLSTKTLGARLKKLEHGGIVARRSFSEAPPRVEYSLTEKGRALLRVIDAIADVANEWDCAGEGRVAVASCRACHADEDESADQAATTIKPRKRTDVTLL